MASTIGINAIAKPKSETKRTSPAPMLLNIAYPGSWVMGWMLPNASFSCKRANKMRRRSRRNPKIACQLQATLDGVAIGSGMRHADGSASAASAASRT